MNLVDLLIVLLLGAAIAHGLTQGAAMQVFSFGGFWGGLALGAFLGPVLANFTDAPFSQAVVSMAALFGIAAAGGAIGRAIGTKAWGTLRRLKLGPVDSAFGSLIAAFATLVAVWLFALIVSTGPSRTAANAVQNSAIVRQLAVRLPPAPTVFARLRSLVDTSGFPQAFAALEPPPAAPVALPDDPTVQAAVAAAGDATLRIVGPGCGGVQTGSGFVAAPGLVVTNAHVVAGIDNPRVEDRRGRRRSTVVVLFDPELDIAVLRGSDLPAPLPILPGEAQRGEGAAFIGYPGGGGFTAGAAAVLRKINAVGRDIYGRNLSQRPIYQLQAAVRQGNSGGPFVDRDGRVLGVIFAASTTDSSVGYAITTPPVLERVRAASGRTGAADTGPCTS